MRESGLLTEKSKLDQNIIVQADFQKQFCDNIWDCVKNIDQHKNLKKSLV